MRVLGLLLAGVLVWSAGSAGAEPVTVDARPFLDAAAADAGIQKAINSIRDSGGVVVLPAGRFVLERYLFLPSGVTLRGAGMDKTILACGNPQQTAAVVGQDAEALSLTVEGDLSTLRPGMVVAVFPHAVRTHSVHMRFPVVKAVEGQTIRFEPFKFYSLNLNAAKPFVGWGRLTRLAAPAVKGESTVRITDPHLLRPGRAISFEGKGDQWGFHYNTVTAVDGDTLTLERALTVDAPADTIVRLAHSAIASEDQSGIGIEDLTIEGELAEDRRLPWSGFTLAGIHFNRCSDGRLRNVEVRNWNGDGISVQGGRNFTVEDCAARRCFGHGFHPGTGLNDAVFERLTSLFNTGDGLYYCWHNKRVHVRHSTLSDNDAHGVGGLGIPSDTLNIVEHNTIERNGRSGVEMTGGKSNTVRHNTIRDNSRLQPGKWPGILMTAVYSDPCVDHVIEGNIVASTLETPTQAVGIEERHADADKRFLDRPDVVNGQFRADRNRIVNNQVSGHRDADVIVRGPASVIEGDAGGKVVLDRPQ